MRGAPLSVRNAFLHKRVSAVYIRNAAALRNAQGGGVMKLVAHPVCTGAQQYFLRQADADLARLLHDCRIAVLAVEIIDLLQTGQLCAVVAQTREGIFGNALLVRRLLQENGVDRAFRADLDEIYMRVAA